MKLSREEVRQVALLARLSLTDDEVTEMAVQLGQIVDYVRQLETLETDEVQPMAHATDVSNVLADDVVRSSLPRDQALANAPKRDDECFRVPAVLG